MSRRKLLSLGVNAETETTETIETTEIITMVDNVATNMPPPAREEVSMLIHMRLTQIPPGLREANCT